MKTLYFVLGSFVLTSQLLGAPIDAPLTNAHKKYILDHAPIVLMPSCNLEKDKFCHPGFDGDVDAANNPESTEAYKKAPLEVMYQYYETAGAILIDYGFYGPYSHNGWMQGHAHEGENIQVLIRKHSLGSSFDDISLLEKTEMIAVSSNAHGAVVGAAVNDVDVSKLNPNFANSVYKSVFGVKLKPTPSEFEKITAGSTGNSRIILTIEGRPVFARESGSHGIVPLSAAVSESVKQIILKPTSMLFIPAVGITDSEVQNQISVSYGTSVVMNTYRLATAEFSQILFDPTTKAAGGDGRPYHDFITNTNAPIAQLAVQNSYAGKEICIKDVIGKPLCRDYAGTEDPIFYNLNILDAKTHPNAKHHKDGGRLPLVYVDQWLEKGFNGLFTAEELVPVRNAFYKEK